MTKSAPQYRPAFIRPIESVIAHPSERAIADATHGVRAVRAGADLARLLLRDLEMHQRNEMRAQYERRTPFGKRG